MLLLNRLVSTTSVYPLEGDINWTFSTFDNIPIGLYGFSAFVANYEVRHSQFDCDANGATSIANYCIIGDEFQNTIAN